MSDNITSLKTSRNELITTARRFKSRKHMGQNFLIEPDVLKTITDSLDLKTKDKVLEIGAGLGFLTRFLTNSGAFVTSVELDDKCVDYLKEQNLPGYSIIHGDFLKVNIGDLADPHLKIVGNVPYQITSRIIAHIFGEIDKPAPWFELIDVVVLTVQLEVANHIIAKPGNKDYSQITLLTNYFSIPEIIEIIPPVHFYPAPAVKSAVVRFLPRKQPKVNCSNPKLLRQIIQHGFKQRRKMLKNNLGFLRLSQVELMDLFQGLKLDPQIRAEGLSLKQFAKLTNAIQELRS